MARIRTIKPEFWTDEKLALLDPQTRLVFLGLVSLADDHGRLIDNLKMLDGQIFPFTDDSCAEALDILAKLSRILRYTAKSGQNLIQVVGWKAHQKVDHPSREILPAPTKDDWLQPVADQRPIKPPPKPSRKPRENVAKSSRTIPTTSTNDQRPTTIPDSGESEIRPSGGWPAEASEFWTERVSPISPGQCGRILKPAVDRFGWPPTKAGIEKYIVGTPEGRVRDLTYFAKEANKWVRFGGMKTTDEKGDFTEWGAYLNDMSRKRTA